ncbi:hypothetical protein HPP92_006831 [Vanilla planifolia]|uniref:Cellulose synthase RING-type zinc finger domain-containing protein n=1 Tax=Vanilla planifolia TaxID=51239 RepID=A0A835V8U2_VANPL|nr:hypothetical protein HPP92_006831 [Vanilla planifolia]
MDREGRLVVAGSWGMDTGGRLVAGSRNRNEFVVINADEAARLKPGKFLSGQICQICGDEIEMLQKGNQNIENQVENGEEEFFVACNECAFPVCRGCYEYERREGTGMPTV